jgi:hypothetical protein
MIAPVLFTGTVKENDLITCIIKKYRARDKFFI